MAKVDALLATAIQHCNAGEMEAAERDCRAILATDDAHVLALRIMCMALRKSERFDEALECINRAIKLAPRDGLLQFEAASALVGLQRFPEAFAALQRAVELAPKLQEAHLNLSAILEQHERYDESLLYARKAVQLKPDCPLAHYNVGNALRELGHLAEAIQSYQRAVQLDPKHVRARWNLAISHLLLGNYSEGWRYFDEREVAEEVFLDRYTEPRWDGSSLADKTIVIHAEQGIGDEVLFASCYPDLLPLAKRCIFICEPRLERLFARSFPQAVVHGYARRKDWAPLDIPQQFEVQLSAGSLPRYLRESRESFPRRKQFLVPDPDLMAAWRARYAELGPGLKVGISWRAGGKPLERRKRTIPLEQWGDVLATPGVQFINLQYSDATEDIALARKQLGCEIHDWEQGDPLVDMDDYAAKIAALDLIVSVGNATVHMAGAVGTPAWTLLPRIPSWRWMAHGDESPWYQTVRLFRQTDRGGWQDVFDQIVPLLRERAGATGVATVRPAASIVNREDNEPAPAPQWLDPREINLRVSNETLAEQTERAKKFHIAGDLATAEQHYRAILQLAPRHLFANHGLGVLARQTGRYELSLSCLRRALANVEPIAEYHYDLGLVLVEFSRWEEAVASFQRSIEINAAFRPSYMELGRALRKLGQHQQAIDKFRHAAALRSGDPQAWLECGRTLVSVCQPDEAADCFRAALRAQSGFAPAALELGRVHLEDQCYDEAAECFRQAIAWAPQEAEPLYLLGCTLEAQERIEEASLYFAMALEADANFAAASGRLAALHRRRGEPRAAIALLRHAIVRRPTDAELHASLGGALLEAGKPADAVVPLARAIELAPDDAAAHLQHAQALLALNRLQEGWAEYQWRWRLKSGARPRNHFRQPLWDGGSLAGKTIHIHAEQSVDDELLFATCYRDVIAQARRVVLTCEPRLEALFVRSFPQAQVFAVPRGREHSWRNPLESEIDVQIPAGSLPLYLRGSLDKFPAASGFLQSNAELTAAYRQHFASSGPGLKVGVSWNSDQAPAGPLCEVSSWQTMLRASGVNFYALRANAEEIKAARRSTGAVLHALPTVMGSAAGEFDPMASAIAALDLVICGGDITGHLAGGLGTPTFVLPSAGAWRWLGSGEACPWYASVRLFRASGGDGPLTAIEQARQELLNLRKRRDDDIRSGEIRAVEVGAGAASQPGRGPHWLTPSVLAPPAWGSHFGSLPTTPGGLTPSAS